MEEGLADNKSGPGGDAVNENVALVRERLEKIAELRAPNSSGDDMKWWQKRTRMVIDSVVSGNRRFRGALAAFDSLQLGLSGRAGTDIVRDLAQAENLLRNLLKELEEEAESAGPGEPADSENSPSTRGCDDVYEEAGQDARPGAGLPVIPVDGNEALVRLAEAVERDPGLTPEERHDFRFFVRSLQNEVQKHQPDVKRVLSLIEELSRFEVDLSAIRRLI